MQPEQLEQLEQLLLIEKMAIKPSRSITPNTDQDWKNECNYISNMADQGGFIADMHNDKNIAICYAKMQRDLAEEQKRFDVVQYIQHCIDDLED